MLGAQAEGLSSWRSSTDTNAEHSRDANLPSERLTLADFESLDKLRVPLSCSFLSKRFRCCEGKLQQNWSKALRTAIRPIKNFISNAVDSN
jgi:hypothetical protein